MGLRDEFEKIRDQAEEAEEAAESFWQRHRALAVAGMLALVLVGFALGRCST